MREVGAIVIHREIYGRDRWLCRLLSGRQFRGKRAEFLGRSDLLAVGEELESPAKLVTRAVTVPHDANGPATVRNFGESEVRPVHRGERLHFEGVVVARV